MIIKKVSDWISVVNFGYYVFERSKILKGFNLIIYFVWEIEIESYFTL